jgi:hypothetical protein
LTEDFRNLFAALMPMLIDSGLNECQLLGGYGSLSDGQGQHDHYISEREMGRQQKVKKNGKNNGAGISGRQTDPKLG